MITQIQATNSQGAILSLPLYDVENGFVVEEVEGLDPVKATLVSSGFAQLDGTQFQSARRDERNIKLKVGLEPDYVDTTVQILRGRLYQYFMTKAVVDLKFYDQDGKSTVIQGRVESCDAPLFTDEPQMDVSIICNDPDFRDPDVTLVNGNTTDVDVKIPVVYAGTVDTGIVFTLTANRALTAFTIYNEAPDGTVRQLDFAGNLVAGDVLTISTIPGSKFATLTHSGADGSVLWGISPQSNWIELLSGTNMIRVYAVGAAVPYTIEYTNKYGGL